MLVLAPLATFVTVFLALIGTGLGARRAFLYAATWLGVATACVTEALSAGRLLSRPALAVAWLLLLAGFGGIGRARIILGMSRCRERLAGLRATARSLDRLERALLGGVAAVVLSIAVVAVVCPPNTWDVMEYHLPRVMMWIGNRSVSFFPTPDYAQLVHGPFAEFGMLHLDLLWGGDRLVNLIETVSFAGCVLAASSIAGLLGASRRGQLLAAVACAAIPEGALEASGAMNSAVVSLWVGVTVVSLLSYRTSWLDGLTFAAAAGLAVLTKGIAFAWLPVVALAALLMLPGASRRSLLRKAPLLALLAVSINLPQSLRNRDLTGSWLGAPFPDAGPVMGFAVADPSPGQMLANAVRNLSLHLSTHGPSGPVEKAVRAVIHGLGQDPDDPRSIFMGSQYGVVGRFSIPPFAHNEIKTGNFVPLVLTLAALVWAFAVRPGHGSSSRNTRIYGAGLICAFLFFSLTLRWQIWGARLQLPLFVLSAALIGLFLRARSGPVQVASAALLLVGALFFTLRNDTRSLLPRSPPKGVDVYRPRTDLYFADDHLGALDAQRQEAALVNRLPCRDVAFDSYNPRPDAALTEGPDSFFVYPLMALTGVDALRRRAWYEGVHNLSTKYAREVPHPRACAVLCLACAGVADRQDAYRAYPNVRAIGSDLLFSDPPF